MSDGGEVTGLGSIDHLMRQPHEVWERLRSSCPVQPVPDVPGGRDMYMVVRHDDVDAVLRDPQTFSSHINHESMGPVMGEIILGMDGDEHRQHRDLVARAFRASALEHWSTDLIGPTIDALLDRVAPLGRADLVDDVTSRYPVQVIAGIVGVPVEDHERFQQWANEITSVAIDRHQAIVASRAMADYLLPMVHERRANPGRDLISDLVTAEVDGQRLTDERILGFLRLLLPAGAETTYRAMGNCLLALLTHPEVLHRVVADRSLIPAVIEETLRWETSITMVSRNVTADAAIGGCPVPAGAGLMLMVSSANRDETRYDHSSEWDIDRAPRSHLHFGTGRHQCLGMHLARLELRVGLNAVLDRLPDLRLDPDAPAVNIEGFAFRAPPALPVVFTPVAAESKEQ